MNWVLGFLVISVRKKEAKIKLVVGEERRLRFGKKEKPAKLVALIELFSKYKLGAQDIT